MNEHIAPSTAQLKRTWVAAWIVAVAGYPLVDASTAHAVLCNATTNPIYCTESRTYPVWSYEVTLQASATYEFSTSDLTASGTSTPDTVIWVLDLDNLDVVAVDDDGNSGTTNPYDSKITITPSATIRARLLVMGYGDSNYGTADVSLIRSSSELLPSGVRDDQLFGGYSRVVEVKEADRLYVGANSDTSAYDNTLYLFSHTGFTCSSGCGSFQSAESDWIVGPTRHIAGLSHIAVANDDAFARVVIGSDLPGARVQTRFFHARVSDQQAGGWSGSDHIDNDGDGLTWELEALSYINSCDAPNGPAADCTSCASAFPSNCPATQCKCFVDRYPGASTTPSLFLTEDTDHDGLTDFEELFGKSVTCSTGLSTHLKLDPPSCSTTSKGACYVPFSCLSTRHFGTAFSALGAWPTEFNAFVEIDTLGNATNDQFLGTTKTDVEWVYEQEGRQCPENTSTSPAQCPGQLDNYYKVALSLYDDEIVGAWATEEDWPAWLTRSHWHRSFTPSRRMMGVFRYAIGVPSGGQTQGYRFVFGPMIPGPDEVFAHEFGHSLGLEHGGNEGRNQKLNYPSIMNYRYDDDGIVKRASGGLWPTDLGNACISDANCLSSGRCMGGVCVAPCTQSNDTALQEKTLRLSRGRIDGILEATANEGAVTDEYAAHVLCVPGNLSICECDAGPPPPSQCASAPTNYYQAFCPVGGCWIDYDRDQAQDAQTVSVVLDNICSRDTNSMNDHNDWTRIYEEAAERGDRNPNGGMAIYSARFEGNGNDAWLDDITGIGAQGSVGSGTVSTVSSTTGYGRAADFDGPDGSGVPDGLTLGSGALWDSMANTVEGRAPNGWAIDLVFRIDSNFGTSGHVLLANDHLRIESIPGDSRLRFAIYDSGAWNYFYHSTVLSAGTWYRLESFFDRTDNGTDANLYVDITPRDSSGNSWNELFRVCRKFDFDPSTTMNIGTTSLGYRPSVSNWGLIGKLDRVFVFNYPSESGVPNANCIF